MKIAIADNTTLKFCGDLKKHWEDSGHEVKYETGASEFLAQWADIYYIEWFDNNIHYLFNWYKDNPSAKKPVFVVRAIDWDLWTHGTPNQEMIDFVDKWICIAPHMEKKLRAEGNFGDKLKLIRPGVNTDKFTLKVKETDGFQLGMVLGDLWLMKNPFGGLDIFTTLYQQDNRWRLHVRGQHEGGQYYPVLWNHYLESRGIKDAVTLYEPQDDMNSWYENIDILLHPGLKETFCYAVGEAASKGIPVVVNEFYGAREVWWESFLYKTHSEAIAMICVLNDYEVNSYNYRNFIEKNYGLDRYLKETDEWLNII